jgi:hypothetical protein
VQAVQDLARERYPDHALVLGLDANTQSRAADAYHHGVEDFCRFLKARELVSAWGEAPDPGLWTTCNSRTFLQTQLNKATPHRDRAAESQQNLKDWVVACGRQVMFWCAYVRVTVDLFVLAGVDDWSMQEGGSQEREWVWKGWREGKGA